MKEIIYLDTDVMNSLLAQLDQGIISSFSNEQSIATSESAATVSSTGNDSGVSASMKASTGIFPGGAVNFGGKLGASDMEEESSSTGFTEGQRDLLNKKFHDYSLDILISKLKEVSLIKDEELAEGDLIEQLGTFSFYDFSLINTSTKPELWGEIMSWANDTPDRTITDAEAKRIYEKALSNKQLTAKEELKYEEALGIHRHNIEAKGVVEVMKKLDTFNSAAANTLKGLALIKSNKLIGLLKKEFLRESSESLSFRGDNARKAVFLGRVIGVKDQIVDGKNLIDFSPDQINKIPNMLLDILLGSFDIMQVDDVLFSPIAVYYESNRN